MSFFVRCTFRERLRSYGENTGVVFTHKHAATTFLLWSCERFFAAQPILEFLFQVRSNKFPSCVFFKFCPTQPREKVLSVRAPSDTGYAVLRLCVSVSRRGGSSMQVCSIQNRAEKRKACRLRYSNLAAGLK